MDKETGLGQRRALTAAALLPAVVGTLRFPLEAAGRLAWLCPILALPVGLLLYRLWREVSLEGMLARWGRLLGWGYLLWGIALLWGTAAGSTGRLLRSLGAGGRRETLWLTLLLLTLYLTRKTRVLTRAGALFFPAVAFLLGGIFLLSLPALRLENLFPVGGEELKGLPAGAAWALSLFGYGGYAALLPGKEGPGRGGWLGWLCAGVAGLMLAVVGVFGPALALKMDESFLYLLGGVGVPGAFQRGEALLMALAALGDLALLGLLARGCGLLWEGLAGEGSRFPLAVGFALALFFPGEGIRFLAGWGGLAGNLIFGAGIPLLSVFTRKVSGAKIGSPHFVGEK